MRSNDVWSKFLPHNKVDVYSALQTMSHVILFMLRTHDVFVFMTKVGRVEIMVLMVNVFYGGKMEIVSPKYSIDQHIILNLNMKERKNIFFDDDEYTMPTV